MDATDFLRLNGEDKITVTNALVMSGAALNKDHANRIITGPGQGVYVNRERISEDREVGPCRISLGWKTIKIMQ